MNRFRRAARRLFTANLRSVSVQAISSPLMDALGSVGIALLLLFGRQRILHHDMTAGSFITFLIAVFTLYDPVRSLRCSTTASSRRWAQAKTSSSLWTRRMTCRRRSGRMR